MRTSQQKNVILIPRISIDLLLDFFTLIVYITINKRTVTMLCLLTKFVWGREKNWPENQNTAIMNHMSNETDEHWFIWLRWWLSFHVIHLNFSWVITFCHEIDYFGMYIISHRSFLITSCLGIFRLHANILLSLSLSVKLKWFATLKSVDLITLDTHSRLYINITQTKFAMRLQLAQSYYNSNIRIYEHTCRSNHRTFSGVLIYKNGFDILRMFIPNPMWLFYH